MSSILSINVFLVSFNTYRECADGKPIYHWGRVKITFIDPNFPSGWQANISLASGMPTLERWAVWQN